MRRTVLRGSARLIWSYPCQTSCVPPCAVKMSRSRTRMLSELWPKVTTVEKIPPSDCNVETTASPCSSLRKAWTFSSEVKLNTTFTDICGGHVAHTECTIDRYIYLLGPFVVRHNGASHSHVVNNSSKWALTCRSIDERHNYISNNPRNLCRVQGHSACEAFHHESGYVDHIAVTGIAIAIT